MDTEVNDHGTVLSRKTLLTRHVKDITLSIGAVQIAYSLLAFVDRLNPTIASEYPIIDIFIDDRFWSGVFLMSGVFVIVSLVSKIRVEIAMSISTAVLLVWGLLCTLKSLTTVQPVAWSIGVSVLVLGIIAYKLTEVWSALSLGPALKA